MNLVSCLDCYEIVCLAYAVAWPVDSIALNLQPGRDRDQDVAKIALEGSAD